MLLENMTLLENANESTDDIAASTTTTYPRKYTQVGVKYSTVRGSTNETSSVGSSDEFVELKILFQSETKFTHNCLPYLRKKPPTVEPRHQFVDTDSRNSIPKINISLSIPSGIHVYISSI